MSKQLVIVDFDPKDKPRMSEALTQQGHKFVTAFIREDGKSDTKPSIYHLTGEQIEAAIDESPKKAGKTVLEKIAECTTVEEVKALINSRSSKAVQDAAKAKIKELK